MKGIIRWWQDRRARRERAARAASVAVQLVLNGHLAPPRLAGAKGRVGLSLTQKGRVQRSALKVSLPPFQALVGPGGVA